MTNLPKSLEKLRDEMAEATSQICYCAGSTCSGCESNTKKLVSLGFDAGALAGLEMAEKLAEAVEAFNQPEWMFNDDLADEEAKDLYRAEAKQLWDTLKAYREKMGTV